MPGFIANQLPRTESPWPAAVYNHYMKRFSLSQSLISHIVALLALGALLGCVTPANARTWVIEEDGSGHAPTIQAGIDSASLGDTVLVGPGRFFENIVFKGKSIVVQGYGSASTLFDGRGTSDSCVLLLS